MTAPGTWGRQRGFRLRKEKREAEKGKKRAALAPGRIRNFAADYLLGRAGDAGFGRKRSCRSTHLLNEYAGRWADTRGFPQDVRFGYDILCVCRSIAPESLTKIKVVEEGRCLPRWIPL
ncbi:hypothetical protein AVEN_154268-1 [Araneus ventricosus]|uniref:Uncharacterized protein n=1 Tax=Araneus ventricosus TaxID=182803 RepID=A0A4Y2N6X4_ARAVE|nr:hypothetical protein AVEN_154268-1 [Araneus ventricosus]